MRTAATASLAPWFFLSPALLGAQDVFELHAIAPGVVVADVLPNPAAYAFANSLIVLGEDGVLVVDTQQSLSAAESLIAEIRRMTDVPVRWVVNTHWHADHVNGNQAYAEAFPGVEFIAHATTAGDMATLGAQRRAQERAELPAAIEARREWLASGIGPDQAPLSDASRAAVQRSLDLRVAYLGELERITPTQPTRIVDDRLELRVGRHRVLVMHLGPAHTRGDLVVFLPDERILAVGDLLEEGMPWFEDAAPAGWLRALRRVADLNPAVIVPSHGTVQRDDELLIAHRRLLGAVLEQAVPLGEPTQTAEPPQPRWPELEALYAERYGVTAAAFREAAGLALSRASLERGD